MSKARHIKADGSTTLVEPNNGTDFSLEELKKYVGGYIEIVRLTSEFLMVCNEEGKILGLPQNIVATVLYNASPLTGMDTIVGDVLLCDASNIL